MEGIKKIFEKHREIVMYIVFGLATTLVSLAVYSACVELLAFDITVSSGISWVMSVSFAFVTNKLFVFEASSRQFTTVLRECLSFFGARLLSGAVEIFMPELLYGAGLDFELFGIKGFAAKLLVNVIVIIMNYVLSKLFVFRKGR